MDIWDTNRLTIFVAFVIPGFVSLKAYELLFPTASNDSSKRLVDAVAYSCINYALLLWPIYEVESRDVRSSNPSLYILFWVCVVLVAPILWVFLFAKFRKTELFQRSLPHPTGKPWDYVFAQRKPYWVIVTLDDGSKIAGKYGISSFASSAPAPDQLYLEQAWVFENDGFERPRSESAGILILAPNIVSVELVNIKESTNERQDAD